VDQEVGGSNPPSCTSNIFKALNFGLDAWLRLLSQPTLVMAGTDDPIVPVANGRILAKLIPDARLVTIDDGHLFLVTSAGESAEIIADFLD
jgi:pimeloyl-ACP methyl ester carboxylesterase